MKTTMRKLVVVMGTVAMAGGAWAADNATATATAAVLAPISIAKSIDMIFGNVTGGNGLVTLSTAGARSKAGTTALPTSGSSPAAAKFSVTGTGNNTFSISTTGSDTNLTSGSDTMAITWLIEAQSGATAASGITSAGSNSTTGTLATGAAVIYGGGLLTVGASQAAGSYTGNLVVTVAYN